MSSSLVAYLHQTSILFEWYVVCYGSKNGQHKSLKENQIASSKYVNHSSFNKLVNIFWGGGVLYDHLMSTRIFILNEQDIHISSKRC